MGLGATLLYTGGIYFYQAPLTAFDQGTTAFTLSPVDYVLIGVSLFFALIDVLGLALCLGLFVGDRQGAQVLLLPISTMAIVPMFATMFTDFDTLSLAPNALLFAIPLTHPIIAQNGSYSTTAVSFSPESATKCCLQSR